MELLIGNENCAVPLCVCWVLANLVTYSGYVHVDGYTTYVHVIQVYTKKQAVSRSPHLFIAETLNTVNPVPADGHTSVCFIGKIITL